MPLTIIPLLLLGIPILEIAVFILLGDAIGLWATLLMIFVTAVIGSILLRMQGFGLMRTIQQETEAGRIPGEALGHGAMIMVAGVLLLTPGFVTDGLGFLLFIPQFRRALWAVIRSKITVASVHASHSYGGARHSHRNNGPVVDLDEEDWDVAEEPGKSDPSSPWLDDKTRD
ncbi:FxsA family protein [Coralliovum pocilloporae]|uniref:FxsA family protein n=1 Tax=Coralliovum pocilloporae TaxID=3066369 RepID=UPI003306B209